MAKIISKIIPNRDAQGRLRRTNSGHYRFDLYQTREDGQPYFSVVGLRFDADRRRVLPVTIVRGSAPYTVAEVAPESHAEMAQAMLDIIEEERQLLRQLA
jgi:hypothetical protein